jgi:hypothetical protein
VTHQFKHSSLSKMAYFETDNECFLFARKARTCPFVRWACLFCVFCIPNYFHCKAVLSYAPLHHFSARVHTSGTLDRGAAVRHRHVVRCSSKEAIACDVTLYARSGAELLQQGLWMGKLQQEHAQHGNFLDLGG